MPHGDGIASVVRAWIGCIPLQDAFNIELLGLTYTNFSDRTVATVRYMHIAIDLYPMPADPIRYPSWSDGAR